MTERHFATAAAVALLVYHAIAELGRSGSYLRALAFAGMLLSMFVLGRAAR